MADSIEQFVDLEKSAIELYPMKINLHVETDLEREHEKNMYDRFPMNFQVNSPNKGLAAMSYLMPDTHYSALKSPSTIRRNLSASRQHIQEKYTKRPRHEPDHDSWKTNSHKKLKSPFKEDEPRRKSNSYGSSSSFNVVNTAASSVKTEKPIQWKENMRDCRDDPSITRTVYPAGPVETTNKSDIRRRSCTNDYRESARTFESPKPENSNERFPRTSYTSPREREKHNNRFNEGRRSLGNWNNSCGSPVNTSPNFGRRANPDALTEVFRGIAQDINKAKEPFIDTHCHIDFMFRTLRYQKSFSEFIEDCKESVPFPDNFDGCVAVFCEPKTFSKVDWWKKILSHPKVWGAFGCHPHHADQFGKAEENQLIKCLKYKKTMAIGEMGLDYSGKNFVDPAVQKDVFRRQISIGKRFAVSLVIHCRDAHKDCLQILKEEVPRKYVIHRHCYTGDTSEAFEFMDAFPNLYFGFTCLITKTDRKLEPLREAVGRIPLNRILLETDAPYFRPQSIDSKIQIAHPGMAIYVAREIASLKRISLSAVLIATRRNSNLVYGI